ncbi:MAG: type II/IV secretion system protein [Lentisphaerae bacterium]|nr:type II/IV secretion system protein [Lentisphaerota bacterium]
MLVTCQLRGAINPSWRRVWVCFGALRRLVLGLVCVGVWLSAGAEPIPLYNGQTLHLEVVESGSSGLVVRDSSGGLLRLRWDQVDRSYPRHPMHGRKYSYEEGGAAASSPAVTGAAAAWRRHALGSGFTWCLLAGFVMLWLWALSVWCLGVSGIYPSPRQRWVNLAALVAGPFLAVPLVLRHRGWSGLLGRERPPTLPSAAGGPSCRFFTWDNEPLVPSSNRRFASGLALAELIMSRAVKAGASDVHFDVAPEGVRVVLRVDGMLRQPEFLEAGLGRKAMTAIKMAAGMDLGRLHDAQDGACHLEAAQERYDLRVARAWAVNGETLVVRLLRTQGLGDSLTDLGMPERLAGAAQQLAEESAGLIIVCGPTGSGKTSTIYALLRRLQGTGRNILTIEDPVEYRLEHATQISLNAALGSTFASVLKASMRHDPDVILVGEIRDQEAMNVAFQAALTGHLVFTTIHATSVLAAFGRLQELGLSAYMINTGLKAILCQRLVRRLCPDCREAYVPDAAERRFWGLDPDPAVSPGVFYRPVGCRLCEQTGWRGRRGIYRMLMMDNAVRAVVRDDMATGDLQEAVEAVVLGTVRGYVDDLLWNGTTSSDELRRTLDMFDFGKVLSHGHAR